MSLNTSFSWLYNSRPGSSQGYRVSNHAEAGSLCFVMHSWMSIVHVMRRGLKYDMPNLVLFLFVFCFTGYARFQESTVLVFLKLCLFPWRLSLPKLCRAAGSQSHCIRLSLLIIIVHYALLSLMQASAFNITWYHIFAFISQCCHQPQTCPYPQVFVLLVIVCIYLHQRVNSIKKDHNVIQEKLVSSYTLTNETCKLANDDDCFI